MKDVSIEDVNPRLPPILDLPPKKLGVYNDKTIYLYINRNKYYLKYDDLMFGIPEQFKQEKLNSSFSISDGIDIIDWRMGKGNNNKGLGFRN